MNWSTDYPQESGYYFTRTDHTSSGWSIRFIDATDKTVWSGNDAWTFEDYKIFGDEFGDKIGPPE